MHPSRAQEIHRYWFGDLDHTPEYFKTRNPFWFFGGDQVDAEIRQRFGEDLEAAVAGKYDHWQDTPKGCLALTLVLDQFALNLYREQPPSYEYSARAIPIVKKAIARGFDWALSPVERVFMYLPLEHAENLPDQDESVRLFERLAASAQGEFAGVFSSYLDYARRHQRVVKRFGRFPDRNEVFGRTDTAEEAEFLKSDEAPF